MFRPSQPLSASQVPIVQSSASTSPPNTPNTNSAAARTASTSTASTQPNTTPQITTETSSASRSLAGPPSSRPCLPAQTCSTSRTPPPSKTARASHSQPLLAPQKTTQAPLSLKSS